METQKAMPNRDSKLDECKQKSKNTYWKHLLSQHEKKYAALERRLAALTERVKFMECALPSLLMGTAINSPQDSGNPKLSSSDPDNA